MMLISFLNRKTINVFMIGVGLIGSTLIDQMIQNKALLKSQNGIEMKICGSSEHQNMILNPKA